MSMCMHVYAHTRMYIHKNTCTYMHTRTYTHTCTRTHTHTHMYLHLNAHRCNLFLLYRSCSKAKIAVYNYKSVISIII